MSKIKQHRDPFIIFPQQQGIFPNFMKPNAKLFSFQPKFSYMLTKPHVFWIFAFSKSNKHFKIFMNLDTKLLSFKTNLSCMCMQAQCRYTSNKSCISITCCSKLLFSTFRRKYHTEVIRNFNESEFNIIF